MDRLPKVDFLSLMLGSFLTALVLPIVKNVSYSVTRYVLKSPSTRGFSFFDNLILLLHVKLKRLEASTFRKSIPKRIILVRHGESEGNVDPRAYSEPDRYIDLSDKGRIQALEAGKKIREMVKNEKVFFYVSPFKRCRGTYQQIIKSFLNERQFRMREDPRIREQEMGNVQTENHESVLKLRDRVGRFFFRFADGESGSDVYDRVSTFLESLFRKFDRGMCEENVVIVTHGLLMRLFLMRYFYWSVETFENLENFHNCEIIVLEATNDESMGLYTLITPLRHRDDSKIIKTLEESVK